MPLKASRPCSQPGCGKPATTGGKCDTHKQQQRRYSDQRRGDAAERGYDAQHRKFRQAVLQRDGFTCRDCGGVATVADHAPYERRELVAAGLDPNDPIYGQARCASCHNRKTVKTTARNNLPQPDF